MAMAEFYKQLNNEKQELEIINSDSAVYFWASIAQISQESRAIEASYDLVDVYIQDIKDNAPPLLTSEEELPLVIASGAGDEEAKRKIIEANLRLVVSIAKKYKDFGVDFLDLIQEGNLGLIHAIDKFDYRRNVRFAGYATFWIKQFILSALDNYGRLIRVPVDKLKEIRRINKVSSLLASQLGYEPSPIEISRHTGFTIDKINELLSLPLLPILFSTPIDENKDVEFEEIIPDRTSPGIEEHTETESLVEITKDALDSVLTREERDTIIARYYKGLSLVKAGTYLNISHETVRKREITALKKLRDSKYKDILEIFLYN